MLIFFLKRIRGAFPLPPGGGPSLPPSLGMWEVKKLHHGLIYWENFGFSLDVHLACSTK